MSTLNFALKPQRARGARQLADMPAAEQVLDVQTLYCIPDDQLMYLPDRRRAPTNLPAGAPLPRIGDVVYLTSTSAWLVVMVFHEWRSPFDLRIEVWLEHVGSARMQRPDGCDLDH